MAAGPDSVAFFSKTSIWEYAEYVINRTVNRSKPQVEFHCSIFLVLKVGKRLVFTLWSDKSRSNLDKSSV